MTGKDAGQSSVILKRQVPIRFDEVPTSWLGGLPMMPVQTPWPRGKDGAPLHFLGQIACASLPPSLSRGLAPRKGWLLLFINVLTLEDKAERGDVQLIHVRKAGPEREPPDDTPCVRHTMSDYIDYAKANIRPGVPKMWRKWPVDLVVQAAGAPTPSGAEMYGGPTDSSTTTRMITGVDRPLRWLGALYFVEGILRKLDPVAFARGGFLSDMPPETNITARNAEYDRRAAFRSDELSDRAVGWGPRVKAVRDAIYEEIRKDRQVGWFAEGVAQNRQRAADFAAKLADAQQKLDAAPADLPKAERDGLHGNVSYYTQLAGAEAENAAHVQALMDAFPEDTRESSLLRAFKSASAAHQEWGARQLDAMERWRRFITTQDLTAPLPPAYWARLKADIDGAQSTFWRATGDTRMVAQITYSLAAYSDLTMALREDVLDLYTESPAARALLPPETLEKLEQKLRCGPAIAPHRMGGERDAIQERETGRDVLLFQLGSDSAMGWMWGDLGALYITLSPWKLLLGALRHPTAWIDGH